ncbi:MAG: site-specific integrase [Oxalobacteraceae bacterium]|nr:MAG: site-specific integrase [Oxalobacteraceae bacterium]
MPRPNRGAYLDYRADRGCYYINWTENGRSHRRSAATADRECAEAALAAFIGERHRGSRPAGPRHPADLPIVEALNFYAQEHAVHTTAPERIAYAIEALLPFWKDNAVGDITDRACRAYGVSRGRSAGTIRKELGVLRAAINFAHKYGHLTNVPHVLLPVKPEARQRWLERHEATRLVRASRRYRSPTGKDFASSARGYLPLFILLALYTGARKEALLSLRWSQVNLDLGIINFNPVDRQRTSKGRSVIPIPRRLKVLLRLAQRRGTPFGFVLQQDGERLLDVKKSFARACRDAGLSGVTPHTLRHTCATWQAQAGVDMHAIGGWLGHSSARTTEQYAHHHPDYFQAALTAADRRRN